jgi:hypothetical protein
MNKNDWFVIILVMIPGILMVWHFALNLISAFTYKKEGEEKKIAAKNKKVELVRNLIDRIYREKIDKNKPPIKKFLLGSYCPECDRRLKIIKILDTKEYSYGRMDGKIVTKGKHIKCSCGHEYAELHRDKSEWPEY